MFYFQSEVWAETLILLKHLSTDIMILHWCQCTWQTDSARWWEMSFSRVASFCHRRADLLQQGQVLHVGHANVFSSVPDIDDHDVQVCTVQWNLIIKRSDITKPSYNKVILLVPALYISLFFYPDMRYLIKQGNFHGPKDLIITRFHCIISPSTLSNLVASSNKPHSWVKFSMNLLNN